MVIETGSPASLPLGAGCLDGRPGILALTVQHPPIQVFSEFHDQLLISGPRAQIAQPRAIEYCRRTGTAAHAELEIELAIPAYMGLGSETMLALAAAQAITLAQGEQPASIEKLVHGLQLGSAHHAAAAGFEGGGLVFTALEPAAGGGPNILARVEIEHAEADAWAMVLYFPRVDEEPADSFEPDRWEALASAAAEIPQAESGRLIRDVFAAAADDSFERFAQSLQGLQDLTQAALPPAHAVTETAGEVLRAMAPAGAAATGQTHTGLSIWGLIRGGGPSRDIRKKLVNQVGYYGGRVMATITDNRGHAYLEKDRKLGMQHPIRPRPDLGTVTDDSHS